jgi:hypothetical protein
MQGRSLVARFPLDIEGPHTSRDNGVENVAQSRDRQSGLVEVLPDLGNTQDRRADPPGQDIESDRRCDV